MSHQRTLVRRAIRDLLKGTAPSYNTLAEDRVYTNRTHNKKNLPCIVILDGDESAEPANINQSIYRRTFNCKIELTVQNKTDTDEALDDLAKQVEDIILANKKLNGTAQACVYTGAEPQYELAETNQGQTILNFEIKYIA